MTMTSKLPAHAAGTDTAGATPTVPPAPVKDHSHDAEQLAADQQARVRAILADLASKDVGRPGFALRARESRELASLGLTPEQAERAAVDYIRKLAPNTTRIHGTNKLFEREP
jgi:hypothetical protein